MLTLIVTQKKEKIVLTDGWCMNVYETVIKKHDKFLDFQEQTKFTDIKDVEISVEKWFLPFRARKLKLTQNIKKSIIDFLHNQHAKSDLSFDCYSFACSVCGIDPNQKIKYLRQFWNLRRYWRLKKVGDVVFLCDIANNFFRHAAIYIGSGLYISVYGGGGDLEITTLKDMKKDYKSKNVVLAIPHKL